MKKSITTELKVIEKEASPIVHKATALKIHNTKDMSDSAEMLSQCNLYLDKVTVEKEELTNPLNETLKKIKARYAPIETELKAAIQALRDEQSRYQTQVVKDQQEQESKIAARIGEGKGKIKFETAMNKLSEVEKAVDKVVVESGMLKFRAVQKLKITDENAIPREYLVIDEKKLLDALKGGAMVKGAEIEIIQVPVNLR